MATEVASVFARLGFKSDDKGFHDWERNVVRAQQVKDIKADLGADVDGAAFDQYFRKLDEAKRRTAERKAFKASLGADYDSRAFTAYFRDAEKARRESESTGRSLGLLARLFGDTEKAAGSAGGAIGGGGGLAGHVGGLSGALGPLLGTLAAMIPLLIAAAGAATALAGSFAAAVAGAAAVSIGFAAALGPLAAIAGAVASRVGLLAEAYSALDSQQAKSGATATQQASAQTAAAEQVKSAEQSLADAQRAVIRAQDDLTNARFRARREVQDLGVALDRTNLSEQRANLSLEQAVKHLAEVQADPAASSFDLRDASLAVKEAQEALKEARIERNRALTDAKRGTDTVAAAEGQLADARRGAARAADQVAQAQVAAAAATSKQGAAASDAQQKLAKLSDTERGLLTTVRKTLGAVKKTFQPATDAIFGGVDTALQNLTPVIERFRSRFRGIGDTIGDVITGSSRKLAGPEWGKALDSFAATAQKIVKPVSNSVGSVMEILRDIAVAAQPLVIEFAHWMERALGGLADKTKDGDRMREIIRSLADHTKTWARFAGSVAKLIYTIFNGGAKDGKSLVETMTALTDRWTRFLNTKRGQQELHKFFRDSIDAVKAVGKAILVITPAIASLILKIIEVVGWIGKHKAAAYALGIALTALALVFGGPITQIAALGTALVIAYGKSRVFREVVESVFQYTRKTVGEAIDFMLGALTSFLGGLSSVGSAVGSLHIPGISSLFKGAANGIDKARDAIDGLRGSIRKATDPLGEFGRQAEVMHRTTYRSVSALSKDVESQMKRIRSATLDGSSDAKKYMQLNFAAAADAVKRAMRAGTISTREGIAEIRKLTRQALKLYGFSEGDAAKLAKAGVGVDDVQGGKDIGGALGEGPQGLPTRASGGWIGAPGMAGRDTVRMDAPLGAAVLNRHQQPAAAAALGLFGLGLDDVGLGRARGGPTTPVAVGHGEFMVDPNAIGILDASLSAAGMGGLDALFASIQTPHYLAGGGRVTGDTDYSPQMARAMNALANAYGNTISVQSGGRSLGEQAALVRQKGLYSTSNPTGAAAPSPSAPHVRGVAADITPGRSVLGGLAGRFGLGFPLPAEPWHIQLMGAITGAARAGAAATIKRVKVGGPGGALGRITQAAVDSTRGAANTVLARAGAAAGGGAQDAGGPSGNVAAASGSVNVVAAFRRAISSQHATPIERLALWEAGIVESGLQNLSYGDADSLGALQERVSIYGRAHALNPFASATRFLRQAAALRPWRASAGMLAAAVQRPAAEYRSRYDQVAGQARRYLAKGGRVGMKKTPPKASGLSATQLKIRALDRPPKDHIGDYEIVIASIDDDRKLYEQADRRYNLSEEVFVNPDTGELDIGAITRRASELDGLIAIRQRILAKLRHAALLVDSIIKAYTSSIKRLKNALSHAKKKDRSYVRGLLTHDTEALADWKTKQHDLPFDITDAELDVADLLGEKAGVLDTEPNVPTPGADATASVADTSTAPTAAEIALAAQEQYQSFQAARESLFSTFGSNNSPVGTNPFATTTQQAAGMQYFGAAGGGTVAPDARAYAAAGGSVNYIERAEFHANYPATPPDGGSYIQQQAREAALAFG